MRSSVLLVSAWTVAAALHPSSVIRRVSTRTRSHAVVAMSDDVVAQQAEEISALRKMVEDLQRERADLQTAETPVPKRHGRPPKRAKGSPRTPFYRLYGTLPPDFDSAPIERLIARRVSARLKKHYSEADRLQKRILRMGVRLDDRQRTWSLLPEWQERQQDLAAEDAQSWRQEQQLAAELEVKIKNLFSYWDQDGNGIIDRTEFRLALQVLAIPGGPALYDETFDKWDADGNGGLNFKEIREALMELSKAQGPEMLRAADRTVQFLGDDGLVGDAVREDFAAERRDGVIRIAVE